MTTPDIDPEGEFTELVDGYFPRVDLVGKSANGVPRFLVAKSKAPTGFRGLLEATVIRHIITKAAAPDLSQVSTADLKRLAIDGSADERRAAHIEAGKRALLGLDEPAPAAETKASPPMLDDAMEPVTPVRDPHELLPAASGTVGMTAVGKAAVEAAAQLEGALTGAGAALAILHARGRAAQEQARAAGQVRKARADEVTASTVSQATAYGLVASVPRSPESFVASPEAQAAQVTPPGPPEDPYGLRDDAERALVEEAVSKDRQVLKEAAAGALTREQVTARRDAINERLGLRIAQGRMARRVVKQRQAPPLKVNASSRRRQGRG